MMNIVLLVKRIVAGGQLFLAIGFFWFSMAAFSQNELPKLTSPASHEGGRIIIFVSSSMPDVSLIQWLSQAQRAKASIVLRGFVKGSLPETKRWAQRLIDSVPGKRAGFQIDPQAFNTFGILQVPAVVVVAPSKKCLPSMSCRTPDFDVVYGNVSLTHALQKIVNQHDAVSVIAQHAVDRLGERHDV